MHQPTASQDIGSLRITPTHLHELQDNRPVNTLARQDIRSVQLHYGFLSRHPVIQLAIAVPITLTGVLFFIYGPIAGILLITGGALVPLGLWLCYDALKRGHYLVIYTDRGPTRLAVGRTLSSEQRQFLTDALRT